MVDSRLLKAGAYSDTAFGNSAVKQQLDRILGSSKFKNLRRLNELLQFLVEESLAGRGESLKASTVATHIFHRDPAVDSDDPIVRVSTGRLRHILSDYYKNEGAKDPIIIDIPKGSYRPVYSVRSDNTGVQNRYTATLPRIAVLPLANLGMPEEHAYFIDGLCEELSIRLSQFRDLAILAYWTTSQAGVEGADVLAVGKNLQADFIVAGSAAWSQDRIRVNIECINVATGVQEWAEQFDRTLTLETLFDIQDEIVKHVVACIGDDLGAISASLYRDTRSRATNELTAYEAVLARHHHARRLDQKTHLYTRAALEHAVEIEPSYALAWALLGDVYCDIYAYEFSALNSPLRHAEHCVQRAMALDPECQHAHFASAALGVLTQDHARINAAADMVVELNPNAAFMVGAVSVWLGITGQFERAFTLFEVSLELNPRYPGWFNFLPWLHAFTQKDYERALVAARQVNTPMNFWDPLLRTATLGKLGQIDEASSVYDEVIALRPDFARRHDHFMSCFVHAEDVKADMLVGLVAAGLRPDVPTATAKVIPLDPTRS